MRGLLQWLRELIFGVPPAVAERRAYFRRVEKRTHKILHGDYAFEKECGQCYNQFDPRCDGFLCADHCMKRCNCLERMIPPAELDLSFMKETK